MRTTLVLIGAAFALVGCGRSSNDATANEAQANAAQPKKKKPAHCFFKEAETKDWTTSRDRDGNITVKGKAYRSDPRYKALFQPAVITGTSAELSPTITTNDTGYAAPENWWDVKTTIPNSAAIQTVTVTCGARTLAQFSVPPKG